MTETTTEAVIRTIEQIAENRAYLYIFGSMTLLVICSWIQLSKYYIKHKSALDDEDAIFIFWLIGNSVVSLICLVLIISAGSEELKYYLISTMQ